MHGQYALGRQPVIHDAESALLHLARVLRAADEDLLARQVDENDGLAAAAVPLRIGAERWRVDDREVGLKAGQLFGSGTDEEVVAEDARPRRLGVDASGAAVARVSAHEAVLDEHFAAIDVVDEALAQRVVALLADRLVEAA